MESFEVSEVDIHMMLAWAWGVVKNQTGHVSTQFRNVLFLPK
jgi:hypothetical protein